MTSIQHIIPLVDKEAPIELLQAQMISLESFLVAKNYTDSDVNIVLLDYVSPENSKITEKSGFTKKNVLRSIKNATFIDVKTKSNLPFVQDIFDVADKEYDICVYSNPDIALKPYFYDFVSRCHLSNNFGSITRRNITKLPKGKDSYFESMIAAGTSHSGHDCFIFNPVVSKQFIFGNMFLGTPPIGKVILLNILLHHKNVEIFENLDLTFHLGDDRTWKTDFKKLELTKVNHANFLEVHTLLSQLHGEKKVNKHCEQIKLSLNLKNMN